jgi:hypothetical protein
MIMQDPWKVSFESDKQSGFDEDDRVSRLVQSIEDDLEQFQSAFKKYLGNPGRNKPQLENAEQSITAIGTTSRVILRALDKLRKS